MVGRRLRFRDIREDRRCLVSCTFTYICQAPNAFGNGWFPHILDVQPLYESIWGATMLHSRQPVGTEQIFEGRYYRRILHLRPFYRVCSNHLLGSHCRTLPQTHTARPTQLIVLNYLPREDSTVFMKSGRQAVAFLVIRVGGVSDSPWFTI